MSEVAGPEERAAVALKGRREAALLSLPSVATMASVLAQRCRDVSWIRTAVTTLDRFRVMTGVDDLEALLSRGRGDSAVADSSVRQFAAALDGRAPVQVAALALGPKLWWRTNGVPVSWRPLTTAVARLTPAQRRASNLPTLVLIGSGMVAEELAGVVVADVGELNDRGEVTYDPFADPLAVRYRDADDGREWVTFLSATARDALHARLNRLGGPQAFDLGTPLVDPGDLASAHLGQAALIEAGHDVNVALCIATGDFFRTWGMPGARFEKRQHTQS